MESSLVAVAMLPKPIVPTGIPTTVVTRGLISKADAIARPVTDKTSVGIYNPRNARIFTAASGTVASSCVSFTSSASMPASVV